MKIIIYILLFLLIISIANNYILHYYQIEEDNNKPSESNHLVEPSKLPENVGILTLHIFYNKDEKYQKCHESDQLTEKSSHDQAAMLVNIKKIIADIYKNNKCYIVKNNSNEKNNLNKYLEQAIKKVA